MDAIDDDLAAKPDAALVEYLHIPQKFVSPGRRIARRLLYAIGALFAAVFIVFLDRDGYRDVTEQPLTLLDCFYYATVSLSTTGYGDITPFTPSARLINVLVITPLRVARITTPDRKENDAAPSGGEAGRLVAGRQRI